MKKIAEIIKSDPKYNSSNSWQWFNKKVKALSATTGITPFQTLAEGLPRQKTEIIPGGMYFYFYNPKYKDELPYYDTFPLVLPFSQDKRHFTGLNLHYLPIKYRAVLLDKLLENYRNNRFNNRKYIEVSWAMLKDFAKYPEVQPCVKMYLKGHVMSRFVQVPLNEWIMAACLPVESFKKEGMAKVHADSISQINQRMKKK